MPIPELKKPSSYLQDSPKQIKKKTGGRLKAVITVLIVGFLGLALVGVLAFTILMAWISRDLPKPNTLMTREIPLSTKIYDRTGETLLYEIHGEEKRTLISLEQIPDNIKHATIALEDRAFYEHSGINWKRMLKAVYVDIIERRKAQGASTLTQQLVKNAILTPEKKFTRKFKEILMALQIERTFTKDQILQMYLNEIPYGALTYGIESASQSYFAKPASELTLDEAALLASIPQAPDKYNPYGAGVSGDHRDELVDRQHFTLDSMARDNYISQEQAEEAKKIDTLSKLVPQEVSDIKAPHFVMYVRGLLIEKYGQKTVEQGGLKVTTTLDWDKQQIADEEVKNGVEKYGSAYKYTNSALIALDPKNGQILSMVGSANFFDPEIDGQVNVTTRPRQPGSSFKPIVYTAALIKGYTPETVLWDVITTFKSGSGTYTPHNYGSYHGPLTMRKALQGSLNIPAVKMMYLVGIGRVLDFAEQLGYTTFEDRDRFGLALVLGGGEVKLLEHANAYAAFANQGVQYPITSILKVEDPDGQLLEEWLQPEGNQAVPKDAALWITNILTDNNSRAYIFGINNALTLPGRQVAAKTGTTNNFKDAWTMGYTPNLVAGVWCGNSDGAEMGSGADGSIIAAPVWQKFMRRALEDMPVESFEAPPPIETDKPVLTGKSFKTELEIDTVSGKLATEYTPEEFKEKKEFFEGHNILYYVDKDNPQGPPPANPESDPQFSNWESAVQKWIEKENWHTTSTAPTEYDDVHTPENQPSLSILSPHNNSDQYSRDFQINVTAQAKRPIARIEAFIGQSLIAQSTGYGTLEAHIPNTIPRGYHEIIVKVIDDVGNRAQDSITINLNADLAPLNVYIVSPANGTRINQASFPIQTIIQISDLADVAKIDLKMNQDGKNLLIGSIIGPDELTNQISWNAVPEIGSLTLYPEIKRKDGSTSRGDQITLTIDP
ncbi:MAG: transglycosylase domain-containing protein [Patescibacteria group bacterium]